MTASAAADLHHHQSVHQQQHQQYYSGYAMTQQQQQTSHTAAMMQHTNHSAPQQHLSNNHSSLSNQPAVYAAAPVSSYHEQHQPHQLSSHHDLNSHTHHQQQQQHQHQQHSQHHHLSHHHLRPHPQHHYQQAAAAAAAAAAVYQQQQQQQAVAQLDSTTATGVPMDTTGLSLTSLDQPPAMTDCDEAMAGSGATPTTTTSTGAGAQHATGGLQYNQIEATKSTKGASKLRRDLINNEVMQLRDLLPLPASTRQRLSQLQLMALVLVYIRKSNYFCSVLRNYGIARELSTAVSTSGFSKSLNGFIMMLTQKGKLLYISDNAAEYLGHSMEDLLSHGDEVYDIIEDHDKKIVRTDLLANEDDSPQGSSPSTSSKLSPSSTSSASSRTSSSASSTSSSSSASISSTSSAPFQNTNNCNQSSNKAAASSNPINSDTRIALCRMNVSRNSRRQMRFGDQKVVLIEGHYSGLLPLSSRDEPVFIATCTPIAMPETRECVVQGSTNVFTSIHSMDMKFLYIDGIGEYHLDCTKQQLHGTSWYQLVHNDHLLEAQTRHRRITSNEQERSTIALLKMMSFDQTRCIWVHTVMQVKEAADSSGQSVIVCTNQVLSEREAQVMRANSWLYQFYSLHSKMHCSYPPVSPTTTQVDPAGTPNSVACSERSEDVRPCGDTIIKAPTSKSATATTVTTTVAGDQTTATTKGVKSESQTANEAETPPATDSNNDVYTALEPAAKQPRSGTKKSSAEYRKQSNKFSSSSPSSSASAASAVSSSPLSSSYTSTHQQQHSSYYHPLVAPTQPSVLVDGAAVSGAHLSGGSLYSLNSTGSSSVSSTSSSSTCSAGSLQGDPAATPTSIPMASSTAKRSAAAAAAVAALTSHSVAAHSALSLYAGIDPAAAALDPLQHHMHSHQGYSAAAAAPNHQHHMYSSPSAHQVTSATSVHHHASHHHQHHHHQVAAVNYANQVAIAAQRVAQHHHHPHAYHPYHHPQHQPNHSHHSQVMASPHSQSTTATSATHSHHAQSHQGSSTTAPTHAQHSAAHSGSQVYATAAPVASHHHHHQSMAASAAALNNAFHQHQHHQSMAAYNSAAAVAAVATNGHHHQSSADHHHHQLASSIQNPYHSANAAAAAAAAQSFHYNKIAATVNASA